jgi:Glycosyltransferase family 87
MRRIIRENASCAFMAGAGCAAMAWLGLNNFVWNDYETEAKPPFEALAHGHFLRFLQLAPAYGGSLIERAPFALLPGLWGGGSLAVYRMVALPCLLAVAALAVWLCARMRAEGRPVLARAMVVGICVANPLALSALEVGHPEELLGACLCVGAVLFASRGRPLWAGALLGLAIANKEWALIAVGPVLLALPRPPDREARGAFARRPIVICIASSCIVVAAIFTPLLLVAKGSFVANTSAATVPLGKLFQPWQLWWFLGSHAAPVHGTFGVPLPGYRTGPAWAEAISHPLIVAVGIGLAIAVWLQHRHQQRGVSERSAMLLLALVLLARCVLDTWNTGYYMLPCAVALLAWDVRGARRLPLVALVSIVPPWFALQELSAHGISPDAQTALFLAWTLPLAVWLGARLFARPASAPRHTASARTRLHEPAMNALGVVVKR